MCQLRNLILTLLSYIVRRIYNFKILPLVSTRIPKSTMQVIKIFIFFSVLSIHVYAATKLDSAEQFVTHPFVLYRNAIYIAYNK